jgi:hypothetical protein
MPQMQFIHKPQGFEDMLRLEVKPELGESEIWKGADTLTDTLPTRLAAPTTNTLTKDSPPATAIKGEVEIEVADRVGEVCALALNEKIKTASINDAVSDPE